MSESTHDTNERMENTTSNKNDKHRIARGADVDATLKTIKQEQTTTWISPDGKTRRQIDYIMINNRYRNNVTKAWTIPGWRANIMQQNNTQ